MAQKILCKNLKRVTYFDGKRFSIKHGKRRRALKYAKKYAIEMATWKLWHHQEYVCNMGACNEQYVGSESDHGEFHQRNFLCGAKTDNVPYVMVVYKEYKTWLGHGGDYGVAIQVPCYCNCVIPGPEEEPFDFLGLVNSLAGVAEGGKWPKVAKEVADLIDWIKKNL